MFLNLFYLCATSRIHLAVDANAVIVVFPLGGLEGDGDVQRQARNQPALPLRVADGEEVGGGGYNVDVDAVTGAVSNALGVDKRGKPTLLVPFSFIHSFQRVSLRLV